MMQAEDLILYSYQNYFRLSVIQMAAISILSLSIFFVFMKFFGKSIKKKGLAGLKGSKSSSIDNTAFLKKSWESNIDELRNISKGKENYLYLQPWFMLLGKSGSGKTNIMHSLCVKSNSVMTVMNKESSDLSETKATRSCDWWMFNEMIALDCSGRYTTFSNNEDKKEWEMLVRLLAKEKPENALNGIIVVKDVEDLLSCNEGMLKQEANDLRERIEYVSNAINSQLPVYLIISKIDKKSSFASFISNLSKEQKIMMGGDIESGNWKEGFRALSGKINESIYNIQLDIYKQKGRELPDLLLLNQDISQINRRIEILLEQLIGANKYRGQGQLKGVYYSSSQFKNQDGEFEDVFINGIFGGMKQPDIVPIKKIKIISRKNIAFTIIMIFIITINVFALNKIDNIKMNYNSLMKTGILSIAYDNTTTLDMLLNRFSLLFFPETAKIKKIKDNKYLNIYRSRIEQDIDFNNQDKKLKYYYYLVYSLDGVYIECFEVIEELKQMGWFNDDFNEEVYKYIDYYSNIIMNNNNKEEIDKILSDINIKVNITKYNRIIQAAWKNQNNVDIDQKQADWLEVLHKMEELWPE
ncbi:MAG: hypothetical protein K9N06_03025 [Candidatus Cloacimonetes bacterium]|nr:hypothetical protein [Candidatus Cloacimonadota bacterium]